ncbi:hypothetical protein FE391_42385 [Nonomuraea sp. KC401]|uniref:hypothetical protein n=1 Tax=unclassified Nonomuraea TaxID=2593643 RepID=UPI0010FF055A|nr:MULTISPECIES: hypothetical protein [unclassified Nonomuraea]NBF00122.1 hypothetical protein [Nonomuraea sp. K271]TLF54024.1 hypothetical protein FE391_42385 [Nonomuraea sp. KC401]
MSSAGVLGAEWTKFSSIRATMVLASAGVAVAAALGWLFGNATAVDYAVATAQERLDFELLAESMRGLYIVQLLIAALGVLVASSEYGAGTMRASLAAVGRRGHLLAAKAALTVMTAFPVSVAAVWLMYVTGQSTLAAAGAPYLTPGEPGVLRLLLAGPLVLTALALFGLALGFLLRGTAPAVNVSTTFLLIPMLASVAPDLVSDFISLYWPNATAFRTVLGMAPLPAWAGYGLPAGFVAAMLAAAFVHFKNHDA